MVEPEPAVEQEAFLLVGTDPAADAVRRLEDDDLGATFTQNFCLGRSRYSIIDMLLRSL